MKTPEQKAEELIDKFISINGNSFFAKECAIVVADEIIKANPYSHVGNSTIKFWQSVKTELETLKN